MSVLALLVTVHDARASDPTPRPSSWSGLYFGVHGGYAEGDADWTFPQDDYFSTAAGDQFGHDVSGGLGGAQVGFNLQSGSWVYGVEGSYSFANIEAGPDQSPLFAQDRFSTEIDGLVTLSARAGVVWQSLLVYGKAGYANADVTVDLVDTAAGASASSSERHDGWLLGAGVETMLAPNVTVGAEYSYIDLSSERHSSDLTGAAAGSQLVDVESTIHQISVRAGYKLDWN